MTAQIGEAFFMHYELFAAAVLKLRKIIDTDNVLCYNKYVYAVTHTSYYMIQTTKTEIENGKNY